MPPAESLLKPVRLLALDVDGVLTDGSITWAEGPDGALSESKSFSARDGLGLGLARAAGLRVAWITGRASRLVEKRAAELGVDYLCQGARDKRAVLYALINRLALKTREVLYIGDDMNDLPAFEAAGVCVTVADGAREVRARAHWITQAAGGRGAVREVVEGILHAQGKWDVAVEAFLQRLRTEQPPLQ